MHELSTVGYTGCPLHLGDVPAGIEGKAEGGGVHHLRRVPVSDHMYAVGARAAGAAHGNRHRAHHLTIDINNHLVGCSISMSDELVPNGEMGNPVLLAVYPVAQVFAVIVYFNGHLGTGLPELLRTPMHLMFGEPVKGTFHGWARGDADGIFRCLPIRDRLVKIHRHRLTHADCLAVERVDRRERQRPRLDGGERGGAADGPIVVANRVGVDRVDPAVAQRLGGFPGFATRIDLTGYGCALWV